MKKPTAAELYAQLYEVYVPDWPGELDFYRQLMLHSPLKDSGVLEIACGTGRVTVRLAQQGVKMTGLDLSPDQLDMARYRSHGLATIEWVCGDMRTFDLGATFGFVIIPAHSFQFMNTPDDQMQCLTRIRRHLVSDGVLVIHLDHQDIGWLAGLIEQKERVYTRGRLLTHPSTGQQFRAAKAWSFDRSTQTATVHLQWEEIDATGSAIEVWAMEPMHMHCIFPFEMEHVLGRVGFSIEAVYGDFYKGAFRQDSSQMIWIACNTAG
jgi:SAM-dependent methyltransferase